MDFGSYNVVKAEKADDSRKIQKWASKSANVLQSMDTPAGGQDVV